MTSPKTDKGKFDRLKSLMKDDGVTRELSATFTKWADPDYYDDKNTALKMALLNALMSQPYTDKPEGAKAGPIKNGKSQKSAEHMAETLMKYIIGQIIQYDHIAGYTKGKPDNAVNKRTAKEKLRALRKESINLLEVRLAPNY